MKKTAFILCMLLCHIQVLFAVEDKKVSSFNKYGYFQIGAGPLPFPIPQIGVGCRNQIGTSGLDANFLLSTALVVTAAKIGLHYVLYPHPDIKREFYIGAGPAFIGLVHPKHLFSSSSSRSVSFSPAFAPEFFVGKQFITQSGKKRHFQFELLCPFFFSSLHDSETVFFPFLSFTYSFGF